MAIKLPTSMDDLLYFTNRVTPTLSVKAWVYKKQCPKCKKGLMGKPVDSKTGKVKIRSTDYECQNCGFTEDKATHEATLEVQAQYTCPACKHKGEGVTSYKRKTFQGVPSFIILCSNCQEKIPITKKLKDPKKKKPKASEDVEVDE